MRAKLSLDDVLGSRGHVRILRALDALPDGIEVSVRGIARRAGVAHPRASQILSGLSDAGLTTVRRAGRADMYQVNRDHVLYPAIHALFAEEERVPDAIEDFLRTELTRAKGIREAYLFGSVARGESSARSDIDLAVITRGADPERVEDRLDAIAAAVRRVFGSRLNVHTSSEPLERRVHGRVGRELWRRIAAEGRRLLPVEHAER